MRAISKSGVFPMILAGAGLIGLACGGNANAAAVVGTTGAANTTTTGAPPGGAIRVIEIGAQVVTDEKIETSASGSVQLLFIDKTTLNIGPNSRVVIDRFVFNPETAQGEIALTLSKGVLRLVGGQATHTGGATIATPVASIGVRGGIMTASHSAKEGTQAILGYGRMTVTNICPPAKADCAPNLETVTRPGFLVQVGTASAPPSAPVKATAAQIAQSNSQLTSKGGQTGGASAQPTDQQAAANNVGTANSPSAASAVTAPPTDASAAATIADTTGTLITGSRQSAPPPVPPPPSATTPAAYAIVTHGPYSTSTGASPAPYLTGNFAGTGKFTVSSILGYRAGGTNPDGSANTTSRQFQAGLSVTGKGASQNVTIFVMTSQISKAPNIGFAEAGGFVATMIKNSEQTYGLGDGSVSSATPGSPPNSAPTDSGGLPNAPYALNNANTNLVNGKVTPSQSFNFGTGAYTFNPVQTGAPTSIGVNHPSLNLQGYAGGIMVTATSQHYTNPYIVTNLSGKPGDVSIVLPGGSSQVGAVFNMRSVNGPTDGLKTAAYRFGSYDPADPNNTAGRNTARGAYVDPSDFAARAASIFDNGANTPLSSRNGHVLSGPGDSAEQLLVTANSVGANTSAFLSSISSTTVRPCACEFTKWGFWSSYNGEVGPNGNLAFEDQGNLLLWVAGVPANAVDLPATGTATYTGHAVANITRSGLVGSYIAAGAFSNTVNFGAATGAVQIRGLDGTNYAGTVNLGTVNNGAVAPASLFSGILTGDVLAGHHRVDVRTILLNGSFFRGGPSNFAPGYGEMGGSLAISGRNYLGSGIFLGSLGAGAAAVKR